MVNLSFKNYHDRNVPSNDGKAIMGFNGELIIQKLPRSECTKTATKKRTKKIIYHELRNRLLKTVFPNTITGHISSLFFFFLQI